MGTRFSMVGYETVMGALNTAGLSIGMEHSDELAKYFELGMEEMLRELAITKMHEFDLIDSMKMPAEYWEIERECEEKYDKIKELLTEDNQQLLQDMEEDYNEMASISDGELFIRGFIEGYRFLKNLNSSYRGPNLDVRR